MQKLFNVMSVASFVMSAGMVAGSVMLYTRIPSITKHYMSELTLEMTKVMTNMMPGEIDEALPELPTTTGPAITELVARMSKAYESRMKTMVSDMVKAVEQGGDIEKSEEQPHAIYSDDDVQAMVMRAFGGFKPWRHIK